MLIPKNVPFCPGVAASEDSAKAIRNLKSIYYNLNLLVPNM